MNAIKNEWLTDGVAESPAFHEGELSIQEALGSRESVAAWARHGMRDYMPEQHQHFFNQLPFVLVGSVDEGLQPWASILVGRPGFVRALDERQLAVCTTSLYGDPLAANLKPGAALGMLGIEFHTRRRNRLNGIVASVRKDGFDLSVRQSFGNCPKYIQTRPPLTGFDVRTRSQTSAITETEYLDRSMRQLVGEADTFFIASAHPDTNTVDDARRGADISHRGGRSGFVHVNEDGSRFTVPDYSGNFLFNTLGNLLVNPRAGLLFIDFVKGDLLYISALVEVVWEGEELAEFENAQRLLRMQVNYARRVEGVLPWKVHQER